MLFNSIEFLIFFPLVCLLFFLAPYRSRWLLLLAASCYFYMVYRPVYILIIAFTIVVDYFAGILIEQAEGRRRKRFLLASIIANVGVLAIFKYYDFFNHNLSLLPGGQRITHIFPVLNILLPIGLSFHTFQAMSYTIEVYFGRQKAERHFGIYSLYVMFFPQMVAGPIERPQHMLHQFHQRQYFDYSRISEGLKRMLWGFFKKVVIADRLALVADLVYNNPDHSYGWSVILATICFAFQIYGDFSGYSDIALGAAQVLGFRLMRNFDGPYFSTTVAEFWRRWHISLSTWFRDYLYVPLGGNRVRLPRRCFNIMVVFVVSGFWHGANWTFIAWGALHGTYLVLENLSSGIRHSIRNWFVKAHLQYLHRLLGAVTVFLLVSFAWIFFRARSVSDAFLLIRNGTQKLDQLATVKGRDQLMQSMNLVDYEWLILLVCIAFLLSAEWQERRHGDLIAYWNARPAWQRWLFYSATLWLLFLFGEFHRQTFIYFAF